MKRIFLILLSLSILSSLYGGKWKISLNASLQNFKFTDLEANKDFWNIALINTIKHKQEAGEDIETPEKIGSLKNAPSMGITIERENGRLLLSLGIDKYHKGFNPYLKIGDLTNKTYEVTNRINETLDILSPTFSLGYNIIKNDIMFLSFNLNLSLNFLSYKYSQDFNWIVLDDTANTEIINVKETNYTTIKKLIPSLAPMIRGSINFKRVGISLSAGYNYGKTSNFTANVDYLYSMTSAFHKPVEYTFSGETELWLGESWVELMGYDYWVRTHLYGNEKPEENQRLRNIRHVEINISGIFLKISFFFYF